MPSFCQHFIEVSDILTRFLHGMIKCQLTLPIRKVHLKKKGEITLSHGNIPFCQHFPVC